LYPKVIDFLAMRGGDCAWQYSRNAFHCASESGVTLPDKAFFEAAEAPEASVGENAQTGSESELRSYCTSRRRPATSSTEARRET